MSRVRLLQTATHRNAKITLGLAFGLHGTRRPWRGLVKERRGEAVSAPASSGAAFAAVLLGAHSTATNRGKTVYDKDRTEDLEHQTVSTERYMVTRPQSHIREISQLWVRKCSVDLY